MNESNSQHPRYLRHLALQMTSFLMSMISMGLITQEEKNAALSILNTGQYSSDAFNEMIWHAQDNWSKQASAFLLKYVKKII